MEKIKFIKMHGLENDFVIIDNRDFTFEIDPKLIRKISDRRLGVGCDQLILIETSKENIADARILIFNSDGSEAETCGNATRCVGKLLIEEKKLNNVLIDTKGGLLDVELEKNGNITVDMGLVKFDWRDVPLSKAVHPNNLGLNYKYLNNGFALNVGNPHVVFFSKSSFSDREIEGDCLLLSKSKLFPQGVNINIANVVSHQHIKLKVFERGSGFTKSCGSGACATLVAAHKLGMCEAKATVSMDGGDLSIEFMDDDHVIMSGPVQFSFNGEIDLTF